MLASRRPLLAAAVGLCLAAGAGACKPRPQTAGLPDGRPAERRADEAARDFKGAPRAAVQRYNAWAGEAARAAAGPLLVSGEVVKVKRVKNAPGKRWLVLRNDEGVEVALLGEVRGTGDHAVGEVTRASSRKGRLVFVCRSITLSPAADAGAPAPVPDPAAPSRSHAQTGRAPGTPGARRADSGATPFLRQTPLP